MLTKKWLFFDHISDKYDLVNDIVTFGFIRLFRWLIAYLASRGNVVVELAAGTGSNVPYLERKFKRIICVEPNYQMINLLIKRYKNSKIEPVQAFAENFLESNIDAVVVTFGFRNFYDINAVLRNIYEMLKPQGEVIIMDVFKPKYSVTQWLLKCFFELYVIPVGTKLTKSKSSYEYFKVSVHQFMTLDEFQQLLEKYGFKTSRILNIFGLGIIKASKFNEV